VPFMFRVTSLTEMSEKQLNRWIKRVALLIVVVFIAFVAFYVVDRYRLPQTPIVDQHLAALEEAVRAEPDNIANRGQLADLYVAKKRYADAIAQYDLIVGSGKYEAPARVGRGNAYRLSGELEAAAGDYQAVIDLLKDTDTAAADQTLQAAYYGLGSVLLAQGKAAEAIAPLTNASILKADADALFLLGQAQLASGDAPAAIESLTRAAAFVPVGWPDPYLALSQAYAKAGDTAHAAWATAMADIANGQYDTAETSLKVMLEGPAALDATLGLGLAAEARGDNAAATDWYTKALAIEPENNAAIMGLKRVGPMPSGSIQPAASPGVPSPAPTAPPSGLIPGGIS
jgi:tetratricopeptide (TPR) repeat protein